MKKIFLINKWLLPILALVATLTSCLKDEDYEDGLYGAVRNTEGGMYISVRTGGLNNFSRSNVSIDPSSSDNDTVDLYIDLDYQAKTTSDVTVKIAIDDAKRIAYNTANSKDYQPVTTDMVELLNTTITIPAGERVGQTKVVIKQNLFDASISYMFPVSITESGATLSTNLNTRYYNIIGNVLAGNYKHSFYRWNGTTDTTTAPNSTVFEDEPVVINPLSATTILLPEDYLVTFVGVGVNLSFTNTNGVLTDLNVSIDEASLAAITAGGFTITTKPKIASYQIVGDASTKYAGSTFRIYMSLLNSAGGIRTVIDNFVKQ